MYLISIVVPTLNHLESDFKPFIESLKKTTDFTNVEVIIVSNGSVDGTDEFVRSLGKPFKLLAFPEPLGYTKAVNAGIAVSKGDIVILLNNDIVFLDWGKGNQWMDYLMKPFSDPKVAITGSTKQWRGGRPWFLFYCVAIRRKLFGEIGFLDEIFNPGAGEDTDFCLKALDAGHQIRQVPVEQTKHNYLIPFPIWHKGGQTVNEVPDWPNIVARNEKILQGRYGMGTLEEERT